MKFSHVEFYMNTNRASRVLWFLIQDLTMLYLTNWTLKQEVFETDELPEIELLRLKIAAF